MLNYTQSMYSAARHAARELAPLPPVELSMNDHYRPRCSHRREEPGKKVRRTNTMGVVLEAYLPPMYAGLRHSLAVLAASVALLAPAAVSPARADQTHTVGSGQNLGAIARK